MCFKFKIPWKWKAMSNESLEPLMPSCRSGIYSFCFIFLVASLGEMLLQCLFRKPQAGIKLKKKSRCCFPIYNGAASSSPTPHPSHHFILPWSMCTDRSLLNALRCGQKKWRLLVKIKGSTNGFFRADGLQWAVHRLACPKICSINCFLKLRYLKENNKTKIKTVHFLVSWFKKP